MPINAGIIPESMEGRFENALKLTNKLTEAGIERNKLYIDLIIEAVATNNSAAITDDSNQGAPGDKPPGARFMTGGY